MKITSVEVASIDSALGHDLFDKVITSQNTAPQTTTNDQQTILTSEQLYQLPVIVRPEFQVYPTCPPAGDRFSSVFIETSTRNDPTATSANSTTVDRGHRKLRSAMFVFIACVLVVAIHQCLVANCGNVSGPPRRSRRHRTATTTTTHASGTGSAGDRFIGEKQRLDQNINTRSGATSDSRPLISTIDKRSTFTATGRAVLHPLLLTDTAGVVAELTDYRLHGTFVQYGCRSSRLIDVDSQRPRQQLIGYEHDTTAPGGQAAGDHGSNTAWLERKLIWNGLHVVDAAVGCGVKTICATNECNQLPYPMMTTSHPVKNDNIVARGLPKLGSLLSTANLTGRINYLSLVQGVHIESTLVKALAWLRPTKVDVVSVPCERSNAAAGNGRMPAGVNIDQETACLATAADDRQGIVETMRRRGLFLYVITNHDAIFTRRPTITSQSRTVNTR